MILGLNREKAKSAIYRLIELQDNETLQSIYRKISNGTPISTSTVLKVWNKIESLDSLDDDELEGLLKLCLSVSESGSYEEYCAEVDTSPIKKAYLETISGPKAKVAAMQFLELFTEKIESVYHKDLCCLSYSEAVDGLSRLPNLNTMTLRKALTVARGYCKYCVDNGKFKGKAINSFKNISVEDVPIDTWVRKHIAKDPADLVSRIENVISVDEGYVAPVALVLAWMKFSLDQCVEIREKDIDLFHKTICGVPIPEELIQIVVSYANATFVSDEDSFFLKKTQKRKKKTPCNKSYIATVLSVMNGFSYRNAVMSSILYDLHKKETIFGRVNKQDIVNMFDLKPDSTSFNSYLNDKRRLYDVYRKIYWTP